MNMLRIKCVGTTLLLLLVLVVAASPVWAVDVVADVAKDPREVPAAAMNVSIALDAKEVVAEIAPGKKFYFWTFAQKDGKATVPGPMIRVLEGGTVTITLRNLLSSAEPHNIDFHAAMGPGGGAAVTNIEPGETRVFSFKALRAGAYIYHCAGEGMPWEHVAHGMYGLIQVDPPGGLPPVDKEFYVGQSDWYLTPAPKSLQHYGFPNLVSYDLDADKASAEHPDLYTFNGHTQALASPALFGEAIRVALGTPIPPGGGTGKKVRFFFVTGGPNIGSNWHIIGTIFDKVYTGHPSTPVLNEETVYVAPGSAAVFELTALVPGRFLLVDHALFRVPKGAAGFLHVDPQCMDATSCEWPTDIYFPRATGTGH